MEVTMHLFGVVAFLAFTLNWSMGFDTSESLLEDLQHDHSFWAPGDHDNLHHHLGKRQAYGSSGRDACREPSASCYSAAQARYRTFDGTCNNLQDHLRGSRNRFYVRIAPSAFENQDFDPRGGLLNSRLANPRDISNKVHFDAGPINSKVTNMLPQFGQFLDHDISFTPNDESPCCTRESGSGNPRCWTVPVPGNDPFYPKLRSPQTCIPFTRSLRCFTRDRKWEQINQVTAFIDGSQVYSCDNRRADGLRDWVGGRLRSHREIPGFLSAANHVTGASGTRGHFGSGDDRVNIMPGLAVMHNLFHMEHNRIARDMERLTPPATAPEYYARNPRKDDYIYQETRRIIVALLQHITYTDFLPIVLGPGGMQKYNLTLPSTGYSTYNASVDATILHSFSTAAFRFGHSMVAGLVNLVPMNGNTSIASVNISGQYFESGLVTRPNTGQGSGYDQILRALMLQNAPEMDRHVSDGVRNYVLKRSHEDFGGDLVARNIQRGRDHGLPPYNTYRILAGLQPLTANWGARPTEINEEGWTATREAYTTKNNSPLEIDLHTGGLLETPIDGGLVGPTFQYLIGRQFKRLLDGDRYFYSHNTGAVSAFTPAQLAIIRSQKLSDIICRNSAQPNVQKNVFLVSSSSNPTIACTNSTPLNTAAFLRNSGSAV